MSKSTSDPQVCDKCGYVLSPFETDCPRCAHYAAEPPTAVSATANRIEPRARDTKKESLKAVAMIGKIILATAGLLLVSVVLSLPAIGLLAVGSPSFEKEEFIRLFGWHILPLWVGTGYLAGHPRFLRPDINLILLIACGPLFLGVLTVISVLLVGLINPVIIGALCFVASAFLSRHLRTRLDSMHSKTVDIAVVATLLIYIFVATRLFRR
jgi:hypothetical protein